MSSHMTTKSRSCHDPSANDSSDFPHADGGLPITKEINASSPTIELLPADSFFETPPVYTIDLSLPPSQRYVEVAARYRNIARTLPRLFDVLILKNADGNIPSGTFFTRAIFWILLRLLHFLAWVCLRRLHSRELTQELLGISRVTGVPIHMLICLNVVIDLLMGCTSGGVLVADRAQTKKMLHFRTLDWIMPELRSCIVQLDFRERADGPVIATSITYVGYVGVLTGVQPGLSVSLNFRPYHNGDDNFLTNVRFRVHQLLVILGWMPSISSYLRDFILPTAYSTTDLWSRLEPDPETADLGPARACELILPKIARHFPFVPTTAAYLTFSDGISTLILEKDLRTAKTLLSNSFIATTNHDCSYEEVPNLNDGQLQHRAHAAATGIFGGAIAEMLAESIERKVSISDKWMLHCARFEQRERGRGMRLGPEYAPFERRAQVSADLTGKAPCISKATLVRWLKSYPVLNEQTHFAVVMDPRKGKVAWVKCFEFVESECEDGL